jgi:hypothetical protein
MKDKLTTAAEQLALAEEQANILGFAQLAGHIQAAHTEVKGALELIATAEKAAT